MNEYDKWAEEYLRNADDTMELIQEYKEKRKNSKSDQMKLFYYQKIRILYDMYNDCIYVANTLKKKAARLKERGG